MRQRILKHPVSIVAVVLLLGGIAAQALAAVPALFARENLVAWCIVPFDSAKRGPEERAKFRAWRSPTIPRKTACC